ncbi:hypothetical protein LWI29_001989 [Acer saccharum]|uniref:Reverse transcriptase Ty1/copia-type domain-containing protein n=1 Tax=Acer saccharum TaxID=4024 RepID=A0AA39V686_ACESA|nr:hypothetical protein LWI29_001989 [Acer saccharum]
MIGQTINDNCNAAAEEEEAAAEAVPQKGENSAIQECNFWLDTPILPYETELTTSIPLEPESTILPHEPESTIPPEIEPNTNSSTPACTQPSVDKELIVYSRRKRPQEEIEDRTLPEQNHESDPSPSPDIPGNTSQTDISVNDDLDIPIALRKGVRSCTHHPISNFVSYDGLSSEYRAFATNLSNIEIPRGIHEALEKSEWRVTIQEEMNALKKNGTWELSNLPEGKRPVGCKWIFTIKYNPDGSVSRYKARLVVKGFTQTYGIDYQETFAPVAKLNTVRVLLSLAANLDWPLHQLDVKNAFLNGDLEEEVYMEIPPGFETGSNVNKVCKLRKSLYGLKQSPRAWFDRFTKAIKKHGYSQGQADHTLFTKFSPTGQVAILIVYVDDIIVTGDYTEEMGYLKEVLAKEFEIKDLGSLKYFLGMEVARSKKGIVVSQRKYILDLLKETGMLGCKPADTPMESSYKISFKEDSPLVDTGRYQRLVGKLIYLSHTRPDIGFPVSVISQFMNKPNEEHLEAVYRILRYLKMNPGKGIFFRKGTSKEVEIYSDADWAGSVTDRRSTTGYCTYVWGNLVTWRSKKQSVVARSSAEAEYRALAQSICEGLWLKRLLDELRISTRETMKLFCDNLAAIIIAKNPIHHDRTKHVEIDRHFIKEKVEAGILSLIYTPTHLQVADVLTKALPRIKFEELTSKLGMIDIYYPA